MGLSCNQRKSCLSCGPEIDQNQLGNPVLGGSSWRPVSAPLGYNFSIWPILSHVHFNVNSIFIMLPNCGTFVGFCSGSRVFKHAVFEDWGSFYKIGLGSPKPLLRSPRITVKAQENDQFWASGWLKPMLAMKNPNLGHFGRKTLQNLAFLRARFPRKC